jgi:membrane protein implicated in regulation of membrane protease activity
MEEGMRTIVFWIGGVLCCIGLAIIATSGVMTYMGVSASYNFGDPTKFQFMLVPFWQIGLAIVVAGGAVLAGLRWMKRRGS